MNSSYARVCVQARGGGGGGSKCLSSNFCRRAHLVQCSENISYQLSSKLEMYHLVDSTLHVYCVLNDRESQ